VTDLIALIFACAVVLLIVASGAALIFLSIRDAAASVKKDRQARAQAEADAHTFDLISKGKGGI